MIRSLLSQVQAEHPQIHCPALDSSQHLHVLLGVRGPELDAALGVCSHQGRVEGKRTCREGDLLVGVAPDHPLLWNGRKLSFITPATSPGNGVSGGGLAAGVNLRNRTSRLLGSFTVYLCVRNRGQEFCWGIKNWFILWVYSIWDLCHLNLSFHWLFALLPAVAFQVVFAS